LAGEGGKQIWVKEQEDIGLAWAQFLDLLNA